MQLPCYRCGATVEEGSAFCPSCNAPLIKVAAPQAAASEPSTEPPAPSAADLISPTVPPSPSSQRGAIDWKRYRRLALPLSVLAGVGIAAFAPIGLLFFVASIVFTVGRYTRNHQGPLRASHGAKMGAFNGLISFVVTVALVALLFRHEFHQQMMQALQKQYGGNTDPQIQQLVHWMSTSQGYTFLVIFSIVFGLAVLLIVSSFIGAISVTFSANRARR
jgi:hypothetical protein